MKVLTMWAKIAPSPIVRSLLDGFLFLPHLGEAWEALLGLQGHFCRMGESNPDKETWRCGPWRGLWLEQTAQEQLILSIGIPFLSPVISDNIFLSGPIHWKKELCSQLSCPLTARKVNLTSVSLLVIQQWHSIKLGHTTWHDSTLGRNKNFCAIVPLVRDWVYLDGQCR